MSFLPSFFAAGQLTPSQFPVFTIYVEKTCLPSASDRCSGSAWSFERVMKHALGGVRPRSSQVATGGRQECEELCLREESFKCRRVKSKLGERYLTV